MVLSDRSISNSHVSPINSRKSVWQPDFRHVSRLSERDFGPLTDDRGRFPGLTCEDDHSGSTSFERQLAADRFGLDRDVPAFDFDLSELAASDRSTQFLLVVWHGFEHAERPDEWRLNERVPRQVLLGIVEPL
jgi:hypothetical protein